MRVWANDDDMLMGALEAVKQSGRKDIKFALGGNGMKEIIKKVIDGDAMTPIETPYPPSMIKTAIYMTAANLDRPGPGSRHAQARRAADHQGEREGILFPDFAVLTIELRSRRRSAAGRVPYRGDPTCPARKS